MSEDGGILFPAPVQPFAWEILLGHPPELRLSCQFYCTAAAGTPSASADGTAGEFIFKNDIENELLFERNDSCKVF